MRLTYSPEALPGSCFVCGSASRESYIDPNISIEFHGAIFLCNLCVAEAGRLLGFATPEDVKKIVNQNEELKTQSYKYKRQLDGLEMALNGFTLARGTGGVDSIGSVDLSPPEPDSDQYQREVDLGAGAGESPEPSNDEGMAELPNDAVPTEFEFFDLG